jgi:hypothetical protein
MAGSIETPTTTEAAPTRLRVRVVDHAKPGDPVVNVAVPMGLVRFGLRMARTFSPELKDIDIDWDEVATAIDSGERGQIVHVEDEAKHQTVDVFVD